MHSRRTPSNASSSVRNSPSLQRQQMYVQPTKPRPSTAVNARQATATPQHSECSPVKMGMSPATRYNSNLKVLRRRDPSIVSIFDQFSHVCVYHHNGDKWEKQGYEGSMFLYERDSYPPYGYYILNRQGTDDYNQRLYPEDNISTSGSYLMMRSYPSWSARRTESIIKSSEAAGSKVPDKFSPVWFIPDVEKYKEADKAPGITIGLWMFATDSREPMMDVMVRLHSYVKQNIPYPDEYRYGPDRLPPPNPHLRTSSVPPSNESAATIQSKERITHSSSTKPTTPNHTLLLNGSASGNVVSTAAVVNSASSELDKLFAKLNPSTTTTNGHAPSPTINSLFAGVGASVANQAARTETPIINAVPNGAPPTGLALLSTIFASAGPTVVNADSRPSTQVVSNGRLSVSSNKAISSTSPRSNSRLSSETVAEPESIVIYSPTPTTTALPQILNQDVIINLLGLPASRASSATPSTSRASNRTSGSSSTRRSGREGGDEDDGMLSSEDGVSYSESSTVLDRLPTGQEAINGDVTPRVPTNGSGYERSSSSSRMHDFVYPHNTAYGSAPRQPSVPDPVSSVGSRPAVTFRTDAELWSKNTGADGNQNYDDDVIVELDFSDTIALSDMDAFQRVKAQSQINGHSPNLSNAKKALLNGRTPKQLHSRDGSTSDDLTNHFGGDAKGKKARKLGGGKQKGAERETTRTDVVEPMIAVLQRQPHLRASATTSSPSPIPALPPPAVPIADPAIISISSMLGLPPLQSQQAPQQSAAKVKADGNAPRLCGDMVKEGISAVTSSRMNGQMKLARNEYVMELLTLIHTDKSFVDALYQDYLSHHR
ncbi:hypothetical protein PLEOSDRAFT_152720 [Pleurotus ostreatus PC15]|uniref:mRNA-decapping enzyme C-terminal domain-containing protein n=1 Tax=Pleurotus ostreatus (strain PC15) TaxID=1137138 RepID=A0A067P0C9_PLEO1|nr:hypothetical protein PLEOSDRAFT_152720 [Pleurotus ostreatus PC15]